MVTLIVFTYFMVMLIQFKQVKDDWMYVSRVVDRILLILYLLVCFLGGIAILLNAPTLYDGKQPIPDGI